MPQLFGPQKAVIIEFEHLDPCGWKPFSNEMCHGSTRWGDLSRRDTWVKEATWNRALLRFQHCDSLPVLGGIEEGHPCEETTRNSFVQGLTTDLWTF